MDFPILFTQVAQNANNSSTSPVAIGVAVVFVVISFIAMWRIFEKADEPGWAAIIPIYNLYIMLKIVDRPAWWLVLYLIPFVNIVTQLIVAIDLAKAFHKSAFFGVVGLWLFAIVGYLILGYGDAKYTVPEHD